MFKRFFALAAAALLTSCTGIKPSGDFSDVRGRIYSLYFNGPLPNATISIPQYSTNVKTDANGYFEIRGLPTKWLELEVSHPSHQPLKRPIRVEPYGAKYIELYADKVIEPRSKIVFERNFDIWTSDLYGQNQASLTGNQPRNIYRTYPVWSRDKSQIGYIAFESSAQVSLNDDGVWVMRADGTMPRRLTTVNDIGRLYHLDWSSDGNQFLFMMQDRMYVYNHRHGTQQSLGGTLTRSSAFENFDAGPVWANNTDRIVSTAHSVDFNTNFRFQPNPRQIYIFDQQGGTRQQLTREGDNYGPAVSHDGKRIAYASTASGHPEIWTMDLNGSNPQQLTYLKSSKIGQPRWSSDDRHVLFTSDHLQQYRSVKPQELWAVDVDGRKVHMVTNDALHADG
ncbi:MAG: hypothetical protein CVV27_18360 [Candidatus Melainabacteria bacterium HGW-Melainabacteria-1]|nr:MAG: hypothetical protein CVV27_18360 [Candidatus Melainabacteria bacterium HGW-Melainabacteria-1]